MLRDLNVVGGTIYMRMTVNYHISVPLIVLTLNNQLLLILLALINNQLCRLRQAQIFGSYFAILTFCHLLIATAYIRPLILHPPVLSMAFFAKKKPLPTRFS